MAAKHSTRGNKGKFQQVPGCKCSDTASLRSPPRCREHWGPPTPLPWVLAVRTPSTLHNPTPFPTTRGSQHRQSFTARLTLPLTSGSGHSGVPSATKGSRLSFKRAGSPLAAGRTTSKCEVDSLWRFTSRKAHRDFPPPPFLNAPCYSGALSGFLTALGPTTPGKAAARGPARSRSDAGVNPIRLQPQKRVCFVSQAEEGKEMTS